MSQLSQRRQTELNLRRESTGQLKKILSSNLTIASGGAGEEEGTPSTVRRFSEIGKDENRISGKNVFPRKETQ